MSMIFFTYRASMQARRGAMILREAGIPANLARTPAKMAVNGCSYGLWIPRGQEYAASLELRGRDCPYERSYLVDGNQVREVTL